MRVAPLFVLTLLAAAPAAAQSSSSAAQPNYLALGHQYGEWFMSGQADSLAAHVDSSSGHPWGAEQFARRRAQLTERAGKETAVLEEKMNRRQGHRQYWRESLFNQMDEPVVVRFLLTDAGRITGFGMGPKSRTPPPDRAQSSSPAAEPDYLAIGHKYAEWFLAGESDSLAAHTDSTGNHQITAKEFAQLHAQVVSRAGKETAVLEEKMNRRLGDRQYWRESFFDQLSEPLVIRFILTDDGRIKGLGLGPRSGTPAPDSEPASDH